ncbi:MAG: hypothetical protein HY013_04270 [Candidatus Solibacter usitatus]|nr:hypothetical protein [Candidatus Solibacter usitatus]
MSLASTATCKTPTIISSQLISPKRTSALGSGLSGLLAELSYQAVHSTFMPGASGSGFSSL